MTTPSHLERGKKRSREEKDDPPPTPLVTQSEDSIAQFIALHSPPPKLARTARQFVSRRTQPPASLWPTLPLELIPLICQHLSSWRDLLRLCRVHRCFDSVIRAPGSAAASCWQYVSAVRVCISGAVGVSRVEEREAIHTIVTINHRQLPFDTELSDALPCDEQLDLQRGQLQLLFESLRYVPRFSWSGRLDHASPLLIALGKFSSMRHLHVHSLSVPSWRDAPPPYMYSMGTAFRSLVSLTLDDSHHLFIETPAVLFPLQLCYLAATTGLIQALLATDNLSSSTLALSLTYIQCSGSTHWLHWSLPLLSNLQHVHATEKQSTRFDQRFVSHKRPATRSAGSSSTGIGSTQCGLITYAVRQSEEWLHSRLTFPSLVCVLLHGKDLLELNVLLTLAELPSLRQLTLSRRAAWSHFQEDRTLPLASVWLPQLTGVDYLDVQCEQSIDNDWLTDLLLACSEVDRDAAMVAVRGRLHHLALQLPAVVSEGEVSSWRLSQSSWPALRHCCLAWTAPPGSNVSVMEARNVSVTEDVVGVKRACKRDMLITERVDRQWMSSHGVEEWK